MCHVATLELPLDLRSAPRARAFLRGRLQAWHLDDVTDALELPLSELVTNALLHAHTPVVVTVAAMQQHVELTVRDGSAEAPQLRPERHDLDADLETLRLVERDTIELLDERDPRLDVGAAGSVVGGRGLLLVQTMVDAWGVRPTADGKAVWIRTATPAAWPGGSGCRCSPETGPVDEP